MSLSTFCRWGEQSSDPGSHRRCPGIHCDCNCHHEPARPAARNGATTPEMAVDDELAVLKPDQITTAQRAAMEEPAVTTIAEHRADTSAPDAQPDPAEKRTRRSFSETEKRSIATEYADAPNGTRKTVLARHGVHGSMVTRWCTELGIPLGKHGGARPGSGPRREAPPEVEEPTVSDDDQVDDLELVLEEEYEVTVLVSGQERDVLDALGFLDGHGDATNYLAAYVTQLCAEMGDESDVKLVLTARRARSVEAA